MKKIFITGATGQDGSYLVDDALEKGEEVHAILRRSSSFNTARIDHALEHPNFFRYYGDLTDANALSGILAKVQPDEIYHLGAQSHVKVSFDSPSYTVDTIVAGTLNMLEGFRHHCPKARFYNAASSEMFGEVQEIPQKETTPFYPRSPYACAKVAAYWLTINYRESYGLHASNGLLFNHESPRRGETFVTRKITRALARIVAGKQDKLHLGNLAAQRDWGFSPDYVQAMRMMLQQSDPDDYVIATGETHSVADFLREAFRLVGLKHEDHVVIDSKYFRPTEVQYLLGDATKAREKLGWTPKVTFKQLVEIMVRADLDALGMGEKENPDQMKFQLDRNSA